MLVTSIVNWKLASLLNIEGLDKRNVRMFININLKAVHANTGLDDALFASYSEY